MTHNTKFAIRCRAAAAIMLTWVSGTFSAIAADGNPPDLMTYQSYLTDANGVALGNTAPKNYDVVFRIYNDQSATAAGNRLWTEQQTVTIDKGYFSVLLGEGSDVGSETRPAINSLFTGADVSDRFIEMTVKGLGAGGTDTTIKPRLRLMTSPYAFVAKHAINAANLVNSANTAVINASGSYVGINKLNPTAALDVVGGAAVSGAITAGSAAISGGLSAGSATVAGTVTANALSATSATVSGTVTAGTFAGNGIIPVGGIIMWSGTVAPAGWALCDGNNGTPDLKGRFVLGMSATYPKGTQSGDATVTLSVDQMPPHTHDYYSGGARSLVMTTFLDNGTNGDKADGGGAGGYGYVDSVFHPTAVQTRGGGQAQNNMPPYYALAYIMRVQ